jgi:hypothetical protein
MRRISALVLPLLTAACMDSDNPVAMRNAGPDFGAALTQAQCQQIARRHVGPYLLRPTSARYKWGKCKPDTLAAKPWLGLPRQSGYAIALRVDAQNAWGNYTGYKKYQLLIRDGNVVRRLRQSSETGVMERY